MYTADLIRYTCTYPGGTALFAAGLDGLTAFTPAAALRRHRDWSAPREDIGLGLCGHGILTIEQYLDDALTELAEYLAGTRRSFSVPLAPEGTPFQLAVWDALRTIPYGATRTYGNIAAQIGRPRAARAVAAACGRNPLPVFIPCHRVVAADGLGGYSDPEGVHTKQFLLDLET